MDLYLETKGVVFITKNESNGNDQKARTRFIDKAPTDIQFNPYNLTPQYTQGLHNPIPLEAIYT